MSNYDREGHEVLVPPAIIFTGRFGSGKTEIALNYARRLAADSAGFEMAPDNMPPNSLPIALVDLDIVTPYFRSRETADWMRTFGVDVVAPSIVGQHLDIPAITPQILGAIEQPGRQVVLDVGGDTQGARALGQFSAAIRRRGYVMHFVVNPFRPFTDNTVGVREAIAEIESSSRLEVTSLVSNPNLMDETTREHIVTGHTAIEKIAAELERPIAFLCLDERWVDEMGARFEQPVLVLDRYFDQPWG
ncbi:MAG: hypothetical protein JXA93_15145 [Anaerolineae bacterium]|nr:hypothetical protein [Anaerolineae bacterium]